MLEPTFVDDGFDAKPGNRPRVAWVDGRSERTPHVLLYLHGFTASPGEAGDIPERMATALRANLYVHRWPGHGMSDPDAMRGLSASALRQSADFALDEARRMGEGIVIVGASLGATLGLWLAANRPDEVSAVVAWSPGVRAADEALLAQLCALSEPFTDPRPRSPQVLANWSETIHPDGYRALRDLFVEHGVDPPWPDVHCPVFLGYYRDTAGNEDQTASVPAMLEMFDRLGTPQDRKRAVAFAAAAHGIGSPHKTAAAEQVMHESLAFLQQVLHAGGL